MEIQGHLIHDPGRKRYTIVGQPGDDNEAYPLHSGDYLELLMGEQWVQIRVELLPGEPPQNKLTWKFIDGQGKHVFPEEGQQARLSKRLQE